MSPIKYCGRMRSQLGDMSRRKAKQTWESKKVTMASSSDKVEQDICKLVAIICHKQIVKVESAVDNTNNRACDCINTYTHNTITAYNIKRKHTPEGL